MNIKINRDSAATAGHDININNLIINQAETAPDWLHHTTPPPTKYSPETAALFKLCLLEYARHANGNVDYYELSPEQLCQMGEFRQLLENLVDTAKRNAAQRAFIKYRDKGAPQIYFTGFGSKEKQQLENIAAQNGFWVTAGMTENMAYLVCGDNAGHAKLAKARTLGTIITNRDGFFKLIETGEIIRI